MSPSPETAVVRTRRHIARLTVDLVDLAGPDGDDVLAQLQIELPSGHGATIVDVDIDPEHLPRLLTACADELRSMGRRRLVVRTSVDDRAPSGARRVDSLERLGFVELRRDGCWVHLVLEL